MYSLAALIIQVLIWIIIIDAVLTWFPNVDRRNPVVVALRRITAPIYRPIRRLMSPEQTGRMDFSPVIAILALEIIRWVLGASF